VYGFKMRSNRLSHHFGHRPFLMFQARCAQLYLHHQSFANNDCLGQASLPTPTYHVAFNERRGGRQNSSRCAMNDEAESSRAPQRQNDAASHLADLEDALARFEEAEQREKDKATKQRRLDAKRKRIQMLGELLRDLDMVVYLELITLYHLEYAYHLHTAAASLR
jgi:hypothetical protein